jgi:hypothetical protein
MNSVHEIATAIAPQSRIVYVDNDPIVIAHGREMLQGTDQATIIQHDLREPDEILADERLRQSLDLNQPVAVLLVAILHFIHDDQDPRGIIDRLLEPLPSGSHLVISHATADGYPEFIAPTGFAFPPKVDSSTGGFADHSADLAWSTISSGTEWTPPSPPGTVGVSHGSSLPRSPSAGSTRCYSIPLTPPAGFGGLGSA